MSDNLWIDVWYSDHQRFGAVGCCTRCVNVLGRVVSRAGIHAMGYRLNEGAFRPLNYGPTGFRLLGAGDFNIEIDRHELKVGNNRLFITAVDKAGSQTSRLVTFEYCEGKVWPLPCEVDWDSGASINELAQVVDGRWYRDGKGVRCSEIGYDRLVAFGDVSWRDYCVTVPITIHRFNDEPSCFTWPSHGYAVGVLLRFAGHADWGDMKPNRGYLPHGAIGWYRRHPHTGQCRLELYCGADGSTLAEDENGKTLDLGREYVFKVMVRSRGIGPSEYRLKVWASDENEPGDWDVSAVNHEGELEAGCAMLVAHHTEATYGKVVVEAVEQEVVDEGEQGVGGDGV